MHHRRADEFGVIGKQSTGEVPEIVRAIAEATRGPLRWQWTRTDASRSIPSSNAGSTGSWPGMTTEIPVAFLAGLLSIITPCVLPLVPGYLSAVSAVEVDRLGEPRVGWRVARASVPFLLGFTAVFVALGAGAAALGGLLDLNRRAELAGLILVVLGLAFVGLLPWPERIVAPMHGAPGRAAASSAGQLSMFDMTCLIRV